MRDVPMPMPMLPAMMQFDHAAWQFGPQLRREFSGATGLMIHPLAAAAAASSLSLALASQAFGLWMGVLTGAAEASGRLWLGAGAPLSPAPPSVPPAAAPAERGARPASRAAVEELKEAALVGATEVVSDAAGRAIPRRATDRLLPEDFRQPRRTERPDAPNDLKQINGIGPKLEQVLNGLGVWTYVQIAAWSEAEAAWVDDMLGFKGRVGRDDWIGQAERLSAAGKANKGA